MRITISSISAPVCKCGEKMEIYLDAFMPTLRVKCHYCGFEKRTSIPFEMYPLSLQGVIEIARSLME